MMFIFMPSKGGTMMGLIELLPQIKYFWEMKSRGIQIVGILADYMVILRVVIKYRSTLNLKCQ